MASAGPDVSDTCFASSEENLSLSPWLSNRPMNGDHSLHRGLSIYEVSVWVWGGIQPMLVQPLCLSQHPELRGLEADGQNQGLGLRRAVRALQPKCFIYSHATPGKTLNL